MPAQAADTFLAQVHQRGSKQVSNSERCHCTATHMRSARGMSVIKEGLSAAGHDIVVHAERQDVTPHPNISADEQRS